MPKPRICIALPGIHYRSHTPYVLMTLPLIPYLEQDYEVTVVCRKTLEQPNLSCRYLSILDENSLSTREQQNQESYYVPYTPWHIWKYKQRLDQFVRTHAHEFDLVIERQWTLVGLLSSAFSRCRIPTIANLEAEFYTSKAPQTGFNRIWHPLFKQLLPRFRRTWLQHASGILVETRQMTDYLLAAGYIPPGKSIAAIPMGIDPTVFFPRDRSDCREQLGIPADEIILVYVGSLNRSIQDPAALIEALGYSNPPGVKLHIIGDGNQRHALEARAQQLNAPVVFHGQRSQADAARFMGAANLCVAPYNPNLYPEKKFTSASLKVCEYLACGRPVLTIPCQRMNDLLDGGTYGFFVENEVNAYRTFFQRFPDIQKIISVENTLLNDLKNGHLREKGIVLTWGDIADKFKQVIDFTLSKQRQSSLVRV